MDNNNNRKNSPGGGRNPKNRTNMLIFMILAVIVLSSMYFMRSIYSDATEQEVPYSEFVELVKDGKVDSVVMKSDRFTFEMKEDADKKESSGLSGAIGGGSGDTFLAKNKSKSMDARLAKMTKWVAIVFMVLTLVMCFIV